MYVLAVLLWNSFLIFLLVVVYAFLLLVDGTCNDMKISYTMLIFVCCRITAVLQLWYVDCWRRWTVEEELGWNCWSITIMLRICLKILLLCEFCYEVWWYIIHTGWAIKNRTCLSVDNSAMVTRRKACYMLKVLECCRQKRPNLNSKSFKYSLPNLHKSSLPLKLGICLHSHVPEFIELRNSLPKSLDLNSVNYSVWGHCNR